MCTTRRHLASALCPYLRVQLVCCSVLSVLSVLSFLSVLSVLSVPTNRKSPVHCDNSRLGCRRRWTVTSP